MGLDITAYRQIKPAPTAETYDDGSPLDWEKYFRAYVNGDFPTQADNVQDRAVYSFEDSLRFRAGSYGGYNDWRRWLASLIGKTDREVWALGDDDPKPPFYELINFSDCEGIIGSATSKKLAADFAAHTPTGEDWEVASYKLWQTAFEMAADGGCVDFH